METARGFARRTWIKLYPVECIEGSIRYQLEPDERGVWYDLLNLAAICNRGDGSIADRDDRPYPHQYIANRLNILLELFERCLAKCKEEGRITEDETGIHITHWRQYQSEYQRQKIYRQPKVVRAEGVTQEVTESAPTKLHSQLRDGLPVEGEEDVDVKRKMKDVEKELPLSTPVSSVDQQIIDVWRTVKGFKAADSTCVELLGRLRERFPTVNLLGQSQHWSARKLDEPLTAKSKPLSQLWNWIRLAEKFGKEEGQRGVNRRYSQKTATTQSLKDSVGAPITGRF